MDDLAQAQGEDSARKNAADLLHSEHLTGLALDLFLVVDGQNVADNDEMMRYPELWEQVHAKLADHGFILRYPKGKEAVTGCEYEPWHIRYVGSPTVAHEIMDQGLTLEEYLE